MKSNLENRFEQLKQQSGTNEITSQAAQMETPLSFVVPTEFVELPSRGKYYPEGHPFKDKESVEIKQMTTKEEDILTNKSFIKKGIVVDRLVESLVMEKGLDASTLLVGDKNAIMIAARISAYGPSYDITITCLECGNKSLHNVDLQESKVADANALEQLASENPQYAHERLPDGGVLIKLSKTGWAVSCRLLNGKDELSLVTFLETKKKKDQQAEITISEQLAFIIDSINGVIDDETVYKAIAMMPAFDAKFLRNIYQKLIPNIKIEKKYICGSCNSEQEVEVPFTQEFFWPK